MALTHKNKLFCEEYMRNGYNVVEAYKTVYPGCKESSYAGNPYRTFNLPEVQAYIQKLEDDVFRNHRISADKIAHELSLIAFGKDLPNKDKLKALDLLQKQWNLQSSKVDVGASGNITINITGDE